MVVTKNCYFNFFEKKRILTVRSSSVFRDEFRVRRRQLVPAAAAVTKKRKVPHPSAARKNTTFLLSSSVNIIIHKKIKNSFEVCCFEIACLMHKFFE